MFTFVYRSLCCVSCPLQTALVLHHLCRLYLKLFTVLLFEIGATRAEKTMSSSSNWIVWLPQYEHKTYSHPECLLWLCAATEYPGQRLFILFVSAVGAFCCWPFGCLRALICSLPSKVSLIWLRWGLLTRGVSLLIPHVWHRRSALYVLNRGRAARGPTCESSLWLTEAFLVSLLWFSFFFFSFLNTIQVPERVTKSALSEPV